MTDSINLDELDNILEEIDLLEDKLFSDAFQEPEVMQEFLRTVLADPQLVVEEIHTQHKLENFGKRGAILDAFCRLGDGTAINVEAQSSDDCDHERRVRYYGSLLTTRLTPKKADFSDVPDVVEIYIMNFDKYHDGNVVHEIQRYEPKTGQFHDNGLREIYLTACVRDKTAVSDVLQALKASKTLDPKFPAIAEYKSRFCNRVTKEGKKRMGPVLEKLMRQTREEAIEEARPTIIEEGVEKAKGMYQALVAKLIEAGRVSEIVRAMEDDAYCKQLLAEFYPGREF